MQHKPLKSTKHLLFFCFIVTFDQFQAALLNEKINLKKKIILVFTIKSATEFSNKTKKKSVVTAVPHKHMLRLHSPLAVMGLALI